MPGQYWGEKQGAAAEDDYYFDGIPGSTWRQDARRRVPLAVVQLEQRLPQGRPR